MKYYVKQVDLLLFCKTRTTLCKPEILKISYAYPIQVNQLQDQSM